MKEKKPFIIEILAGAVFICAGIVVRADYYSTMLFSMGIGLIAASAIQITRIAYWQSPGRYKEYEEKKKEEHINSVDERKQYLRMKAGHITYQIMALSLLILSFILTLIRAEVWVIAMIFLLFVVQWVVGIIVFRMLEKRM